MEKPSRLQVDFRMMSGEVVSLELYKGATVRGVEIAFRRRGLLLPHQSLVVLRDQKMEVGTIIHNDLDTQFDIVFTTGNVTLT